MNIIFLTLVNITSIRPYGIYSDLIRKFRDEGHKVYIVSPCERRMLQKTHIFDSDGVKILKVHTLNIQKTNVLEKGLGTIMIEAQFKRAIKKKLNDVQFDLILYSTPPITFTNAVLYLKSQNAKAISYLLLKDIFPQNAVDIGMFSKGSIFNKYFRKKEVALYKASDYIGCMSPANVKYLVNHNSFLDNERVEVAPNCIELKKEISPFDKCTNDSLECSHIRSKYGLPRSIPIFIYGGNLGKPQGINYLIKCLEANKHRKDCFFIVIGNGTEYNKLATWYAKNEDCNVKLMQQLPKEDYDILVRSCDVGLIFLDYHFTIPNYPSRLLSYLECKIPIICCTDLNTDIGRIAEDNGYGYWCKSERPEDFTVLINRMLVSNRKEMGKKGYEFLKKNYTVQNTYDTIMKHF